ncbi:hypothetical protein NQ176_g2484 [Zarea fungicola]|uniref:Uncharacterized protein n=1 Tax=Zarea fungicola TaxID=93591 RepID=A0ACC1NNM7_9HYPO|nr:hypothetical protein NQ176_g2484 [Lecanicillium fungicola]
MDSHNGLGKLLPKSLTARRKQKTKRSKADETTDRPLSSSDSRSIYGNDNDEDREFTDEADDRSFASYDSSADAGRSVEDLLANLASNVARDDE